MTTREDSDVSLSSRKAATLAYLGDYVDFAQPLSEAERAERHKGADPKILALLTRCKDRNLNKAP